MGAKVVELDQENQKMVVKCGVEGVGLGVETMGGLVTEWLEEVHKLSKWSSNKVGDLVSGKVLKVSEFGLWVNFEGVKGVVTNSNIGGQVGEEGDTVAGVVIFVDHMAKVVEVSCDAWVVSKVTTRKLGQMARVGAVLKGKVVMHKTEHSISVMVISNPTNLSGMIGFLGTRRHVNDLAGLDQGDEGKEVNLVVQEITSRGEVVMVLDREVRRAGEKGTKRSRSHSTSDEPRKEKKKKNKKSAESDFVEMEADIADAGDDSRVKEADPVDSPNILELAEQLDDIPETKEKKKMTAESMEHVEAETAQVLDPTETAHEKPVKKKKSKKKKEIDISMEVEDVAIPSIVPTIPSSVPRPDPGWDFSATSVSAPAWQAASIWSDDELDDEKETEDTEEKSHVY